MKILACNISERSRVHWSTFWSGGEATSATMKCKTFELELEEATMSHTQSLEDERSGSSRLDMIKDRSPLLNFIWIDDPQGSFLGEILSKLSIVEVGGSHRQPLSSGSVERTYQSSAPEGCTYQSSAPEGCTHQSSASEGCTYQSGAPEGCTYQSGAPEGCTYQSSAPEGCTHQSSAPEGCTYQSSAPEG
ncbi:NBS-LRR type resistance protein [Cucumis melo var. makuwa]|uniref:NBS-LRR type resistance protein n=1 Tax=Cucumis melo var. makuwa TaxID=1194695 RepID=A0A5A7SWI2_CUCMM|nr:NBS-LRR type resistance protein [Cucumis melo var. makuwa]